MTKNNKKVFFLFCLCFLLGLAGFALALEINYPRVPGTIPPQDFVETAPPEQIVSLYALYIFNLVIWLSGVIALGVLIYAGFLYLTSSGKPERIASARDKISGAFLGIILLLSAFIILQILNPQLILLETPKLIPVKLIERPLVPPPPIEVHRSAIDTEIPFANIIEERVFEKQRMKRIKENTEATFKIAEKLEKLNNDLQYKPLLCQCSKTQNICDYFCNPQPPSSDPCENVRRSIENIQKDIQKEIGKLREEQNKTIEEIRFLREELAKIERAKTFMLECPLVNLDSFAEFLGTKNFYEENKWLFLDIKFWNQIRTVEDWANFYCPTSGTIWGGVRYTPSEEISPIELPEEITSEPMACLTEVPVGDIIDRTERIAYKLIEKMEQLLQKGDELIKAVDKMQVSVSKCSSRRCSSVCLRVEKEGGKQECHPQTPQGIPCPLGEIARQPGKIKEIVKEIEKIVKEERKEQMGIIPIIEKVVPKIIKDLNKEVRKPMKECITEVNPDEPEDLPEVLLSNCESALGAIGPEGISIENCCLQEPEFQECLQECYLQAGQEKYKECLQGCLKKKSEELKAEGKKRESEIIVTCRNRINFYCCGK